MTGYNVFAAATSLSLAACSTQAPPPPVSDSPEAVAPQPAPAAGQKCDPTNIQQFVGQQRSAALEQKMLQVSGAGTVRWVPSGTAVSMLFSAERLTAFLDENSRINRISCS